MNQSRSLLAEPGEGEAFGDKISSFKHEFSFPTLHQYIDKISLSLAKQRS